MTERDSKGRFPPGNGSSTHSPSASTRAVAQATQVAIERDPRLAQGIYSDAVQVALQTALEAGQLGLVAALAKAGAEIQGARASELKVDPASAAGQYERMAPDQKRAWLLERRAWIEQELAALPPELGE